MGMMGLLGEGSMQTAEVEATSNSIKRHIRKMIYLE